MPETPVVTYLAQGPRVGLRPPAPEDGAEFVAGARSSRELHEPWIFPPDSPEAYALYTDRVTRDPTRRGFLVCLRESGRIAGFVNISNIVEGAFRNGTLGYGVFSHAAGRGVMTDALDLVTEYAFRTMGLHRLEINAQPDNAASLALARRAGFRREGYSPDFLHIAGAWRDHERWALTSDMRRTP